MCRHEVFAAAALSKASLIVLIGSLSIIASSALGQTTEDAPTETPATVDSTAQTGPQDGTAADGNADGATGANGDREVPDSWHGQLQIVGGKLDVDVDLKKCEDGKGKITIGDLPQRRILCGERGVETLVVTMVGEEERHRCVLSRQSSSGGYEGDCIGTDGGEKLGELLLFPD